MHRHKRGLALLIAVLLSPLACTEVDDQTLPHPIDECPDNPKKTAPGVCGCNEDDIIDISTGMHLCILRRCMEEADYDPSCRITDLCPYDPNKRLPGTCGCGISDTPYINGVPHCLAPGMDLCPDDPNKFQPGICGCGAEDTIDGTTGIPFCLGNDIDLCPTDPNKRLPGVCGCGTPDDLDPETGFPACLNDRVDLCPTDPNKTRPGICGCGEPDVDTDGDTVVDCLDGCPLDPSKTQPGICGCGIEDSPENLADSDNDTIPDCIDFCPQNPYKHLDDSCECDELAHKLDDNTLCARIIADNASLLKLRDDWNAGNLDKADGLSFILLESLDLGTSLDAASAAQWIGIGTQERPFDAIFIGKQNTITATQRGALLLLGNQDSSHHGLFGYTSSARIDGLNVALSLIGNESVGGLIGHAENTTVTMSAATGTVTANAYVGGLAGQAINSTFENVAAAPNIYGLQNSIGGLVGLASGTTIHRAYTETDLMAPDASQVGGLVGMATHATHIRNAYSRGTVSGSVHTAGLVGLLNRSSILNAYTTAHVTCSASPCAGISALVDGASTIKNVYTTGSITDSTASPEDPPAPEPPALSPLVAVSKDDSSVYRHLYYWQGAMDSEPTFPEALLPHIEAFTYVSLVPANAQNKLLILLLNENIAAGACSLDDAPMTCLQWTPESFRIGVSSMLIPVLKFTTR